MNRLVAIGATTTWIEILKQIAQIEAAWSSRGDKHRCDDGTAVEIVDADHDMIPGADEDPTPVTRLWPGRSFGSWPEALRSSLTTMAGTIVSGCFKGFAGLGFAVAPSTGYGRGCHEDHASESQLARRRPTQTPVPHQAHPPSPPPPPPGRPRRVASRATSPSTGTSFVSAGRRGSPLGRSTRGPGTPPAR